MDPPIAPRERNRCRLLELPTEIRSEIYRHLFATALISIQEDSGAFQCKAAICTCNFPWQIVTTCHQLRREALPCLTANTTLQVCGSWAPTTVLPQCYVSGIPRAVALDAKELSISGEALNTFWGLKTLELRNVTIWCKYYEEAFLESAAGDDSMIGLALFYLNRINAQLTRLCMDPQRTFKMLLCCQFVASSRTDRTMVSTTANSSVVSH